MKSSKLVFCFAVSALGAISQAVILTPGNWTDLPGITSIPGTVIEDDVVAFSFSANGGTISGSVQNRVTRKADNTLLFEWRFNNSDSSSGAIQDFRIGNFLINSYDADWESAGLGDTNPTRAFLFSGDGGFVNFNYQNATGGGGVLPGHSSFFFFIDSNMTQYARVAFYDLTNFGQTENSDVFSTFAPVPEPATLAVLGLGVLALMRKRKTRSA